MPIFPKHILPQIFANKEHPESPGYYERIPVRVGEFTLTENQEERIVFETTSQEYCDGGPKIAITILKSETGWKTTGRQGGHGWDVTPSVNLTDEKIARRRAMWHALQYMTGNNLTHRERFSTIHQVHKEQFEEKPSLFKDDAYFKNGDPITTDPFGPYINN